MKRAPIAADGNKPIATGGDKPNPALGNKPIAAGGSAPIAAGHIINNTDKINNSEQRTEKIIYEKKEGQQGEKERGPAQEPRPVSAASVQQLLNTGNKINWIDADNFEFNGRYFRIDRRLF